MTTRRKQILKTASRLFKEKGYSAVSMRDLAASMDLKAASLYNHISGKQEILSLLIMDVASQFTQGMERVVMSEESSAFAKAKQLIDLHIHLAETCPESLAVMNNDWMHLEGETYRNYIESRKTYEYNFLLILKNGMHTGEFKTFTPGIMLFNLLSTLRTLYLWIPKRDKEEVATLKRELPLQLLSGIAH
ncbi:MAG: TetR family transcriptional regulator [Nonlabens sp.]